MYELTNGVTEVESNSVRFYRLTIKKFSLDLSRLGSRHRLRIYDSLSAFDPGSLRRDDY